MKTNKYLITVVNDKIKKLKVKGINFLFPVEGLSVGYSKTYKISEIDRENSFLYINRILDHTAIESLEKILKNLPENIIGICFTDLGVIELVKKLNLNVELIYMQNHNTTNAISINYYLEDVDSLLISTDITEEEIYSILDHAKKPLVVPFFMLVDAMYSRRNLLSNFNEEFHLPKTNQNILTEPMTKNEFLIVENEYGTMLYDKKFIDYRKIKHENILYYYINPIGLTIDDVEKVINGKQIDNFSHTGFLNRKTYYNLKEEKR